MKKILLIFIATFIAFSVNAQIQERRLLYKIKPFVQGNRIADAEDVENDATNQTGVLSGATDLQSALNRLDGTGIGSSIFSFTGSYSATAANISEWFGGRQQVSLRCTDSNIGIGGSGTVTFDLPGATALNTAFDQLVTAGLAEQIRFTIEYTGPSKDILSIRPRSAPSPQIMGTTNIIVRSGVAAQVEVTRTSGTISDYVFTAIGSVAQPGTDAFDALKLINPTTQTWDASSTGTLPTGVVKGNAYRVVNAPADGTGRFGEVMNNDDYVVWLGETFTSWSAEPHAWGVIPLHEVRRISALEQDFLTEVEITPQNDRNTVVRGTNYADQAGEIRMKIYNTIGDYNAADLNTTGDIDEYTDPSDQSGRLAIRLSGTQSTLATTLPTLYVYIEEASGAFTRLLNLSSDFAYQGDFGQESDYVATRDINYDTGSTLRIYVGTVLDRYTAQSLDIFETNLSDDVQAKLNDTHGSGTVDEQRLSTLESKMNGLFPLTPDVTHLTEWADVMGPDRTVQEVSITSGYSLIADYRDASTRYESTGVVYDDTGTDVVTYTGLGDNLYRGFGFKVTAPSNKTLLWIVDGATRIPFVDMTAAGNYRINSYTNAVGDDEHVTDQVHFLTKTAGPATLGANDGNVQTFTITNFPANATNTSRTLQIDLDLFLNGSNTLAGHLQIVPLPASNAAQARRTFNANIPLGPLYGNRSVAVEIGYELRVSGSDLVIDFSVVSAPNDITVDMTDIATLLTYTAPGATIRVDNFQTVTDGLGNYTFTGENELLITFSPYQISNSMNVVPVAVNSSGTIDQLNDVRTPIPAHNFESVEIPDDIDFRTFSPEHHLRHSDLAHLLGDRNVQWCYGLARLLNAQELSVTTDIAFTDKLRAGGVTEQVGPVTLGSYPTFNQEGNLPSGAVTIVGDVLQSSSESTVLNLVRAGAEGQSADGQVQFNMSRWNTTGFQPRVQLDIDLNHTDIHEFLSPVLRLRSDGNVYVPNGLLFMGSGSNTVVSVIEGTAAPVVTPGYVGQIFVDTTNKTAYIAVGTSGSGDWALITN